MPTISSASCLNYCNSVCRRESPGGLLTDRVLIIPDGFGIFALSRRKWIFHRIARNGRLSPLSTEMSYLVLESRDCLRILVIHQLRNHITFMDYYNISNTYKSSPRNRNKIKLCPGDFAMFRQENAKEGDGMENVRACIKIVISRQYRSRRTLVDTRVAKT